MSFVADSGGDWDRPAAGGGDNWGNQGGPVAGGWNDAQGSDTMGQDNFGCNDADFGGSSKENDANLGGDEEKRGCFNCGDDGHMKADCPHPRKFSGACRNCDEEGHMSKDCPQPRKFTGACRNCNEEGHMSKDCPTRGPLICTNCNQEGHTRAKCENSRVIDRSHVPDSTPDDAWNELMKAIKERDLDDVKDAIEKYSKACPEMTYLQLQEGIFDSGLSLYLIAMERALLPTYTNMDLQGNLNKKYSISYRFSDKPQRPKEAEGWPETREEILSRLNDAGAVVENHVPYCSKCSSMGHTKKYCSEESMGESERPVIMCYNCNETGHRIRDCPQPRATKGGCRNCGKPGHKAAECEEPRSAANIDCRKCGELGHFSRDCPQGGGEEKRTCHECGSDEHLAKSCPEKKDKGNNFYAKRSDAKDDEANDNQFASAGDDAPADGGGWSQDAPAGNGNWHSSASGGASW